MEKRCRVQGGWASRGQIFKVPFKPSSNLAEENQQQATPPPVKVSPAYRVKYVENLQPLPKKPEDLHIQAPGEYILSKEPSGISKIWFYPEFLSRDDADSAFAVLSEDVSWKQNSDKYGPQPRLTAWYGALPYSYSGLTHLPSEKWPSLLHDIKERLEQFLGRSFNSVLCNMYRDNHDSVDWHCDDEPALSKNPYIASVSLGEVRIFELRKKPPQNQLGDFTFSQHVKMHLPHGSLLVMEGSTQEDWQHRVPKEYHDKEPRINLTFRTIY